MDGKMLARLGAIVFIAFAVTMTVIEMTRKDEPPMYDGVGLSVPLAADPMRAVLAHCRDMGEAATRDPGCLKTWADNRKRFLDPHAVPGSTDVPVAPVSMFPTISADAAGKGEGTGNSALPTAPSSNGER